MEKMKMALLYGADAVYMAGKAFGLRAYGGNFTREEMKEAVEYAHFMGKKVYITVNIIPRNEDLEGLDTYLKYLQDIHAVAVLISELEVFGHEALCISWSGRCLLSNYFTNGKRQSNRGECIQACRFKYSVMEESRPGQYFPVEEDEHGTYIFNSKDLCMIDHIPELIEAGVSSLKIEGRMKSVYYVAAVVAAYRKAIDSYYELGAAFSVRPEWREELEKVSHRPYTTAFAFQNPDHSAQEYMKSQPEQPYDFIGLVLEQDKGNGTVKVQQRNYFKAGEVVECLTPAGDVFPVTIGHLTNKDGEETAAAPHPLEELTMVTEQDLPPYTILRRRARG